jgi:tetratricopeptide (TPR) repeat protein
MVCEAVQHAHQNLVVHRDIKPGNILTTKEGIPKLLDFGIAKALDPASLDITLTQREFRALTPDYASPEQVRGQAVSTASDTYSLGAVLYQLLAGEGPHRFTSRSPAEMERTICETEPDKPSQAAARNPQIPAAMRKRWSASIAGDLDTIILTAMRKEPQRRYASAAEFSEDIRRHMEGLPITAREDQWSYRVSKFMGRNRLGVAAAALVLVSLIGGIVATAIQARRAERRFGVARQLAGAVMQVVGGTLARLPGATAARKELLQLVVQYLDRLAQEPGSDPKFQLEIADAYRAVAGIQGNPMRQNLGQPAEALRNYEKALGLYQAVYGQFAAPTRVHALSGLIGANVEAGDIEIRTGNPAAGGQRLNLARAFAAEATAKDPAVLTPGTSMYLYFRLGEAAMRAGDMEQARSYYRTAVEVCTEWHKVQQDANSRVTLRGAYTHLAGVQLVMGDLDEARKNYEIALRENESAMRLADVTTYERSDLASSHENLGDILGNPDDLNFGDRAAAVSHYRVAVQMMETFAQGDPEDVRAQDDMAESYRGLGATLLEDQPAESLALYEKAAAISKTLSDADPANTDYRRDYAVGLAGEGEALRLLGRGREAIEKLTPALAHLQAVSVQLPDPVSPLVSAGRVQRDLGDALLAIGDEKGSLERYQQALATHEGTIRRVPANLYYQRQYADSMEAMARYYMAVGRRTEARAWLDRCSAFWQDWRRRGLALPYSTRRERQIADLLASLR